MKLLRSKKLSAVLTVWIGALLVSLNLIATIMMTFVTGAGMNDKQDDFLNQTALNAKKQVEQFIDKYISLTELLADDALLKNVIASANSLTPASDSPEMPDLIVGSSAIIRIIHPSHTLVLLLKVLCCISHT